MERHTCLESFLELYEFIVICLNAMVMPHEYPEVQQQNWQWDRDSVTRAQGMVSSLQKFQNIVAFITLKNSLDYLKGLAARLQKIDQEVCEAYRMVDQVIKQIETVRKEVDEHYRLWYDEVKELAAVVGSTEEKPRTTKHQRHRANAPASTIKEYFKTNVVIPFLADVAEQLKNRFPTDTRAVATIFCIVPSIIVKQPIEAVTQNVDGLKVWKDDLPTPASLGNELQRWRQYWQMKGSESEEVPSTMKEALPHADEDAFPNVRTLLLLGCTMPITSAEAERSFSLFRRLKTHLRSRMSEGRAAALGLMAMHLHHIKLTPEEVARRFIQLHPRRLYKASIFT